MGVIVMAVFAMGKGVLEVRLELHQQIVAQTSTAVIMGVGGSGCRWD